MKKWNILLFVLLGIQLSLLFYTRQQQPVTPLAEARPSLIQFDREALRYLRITDDIGFELELEQVNAAWQLVSYHQLPADAAQVNLFLDAVENWKPGFVYTANQAEHAYYGVSDNSFRFRIEMTGKANSSTTFFLGANDAAMSGSNSYYFRKQEADDVYQVSFSGFTPTALPHIWMDTALLAINEDLQEISGPGFRFIYKEGVWQLDDLQPEEQQDFVQVVGLVSAMGAVHVLGKLEDAKLEADFLSRNPDFSYSVKTVSGTSERYDFFRAKQRTYVRSSRYPYYFHYTEKTGSLLAGLKRTSFLQR